MTLDPDEYRRASLERWEGIAPGWGTQRAVLQAAAEGVSAWLVEAIEPQPGHTVLELAAGAGDTGFLAAEQVLPGGTLISTDGSQSMLDNARARARELGVENVRFEVMEAEWIDLPTAHVDGVLCRWGFMLLADPDTALRETRRVLRPGGRVALAAWAAPEHNPWNSVLQEELVRMGAAEPPDPAAPGMYAFRDPQRIEELLGDTGFTDVQIDHVDLLYRYPDLDAWYDTQLDISPSLAPAITALTPARRDELREATDARLAEFVAEDGTVALPGRTNVAAASA